MGCEGLFAENLIGERGRAPLLVFMLCLMCAKDLAIGDKAKGTLMGEEWRPVLRALCTIDLITAVDVGVLTIGRQASSFFFGVIGAINSVSVPKS